MPVTGVLCSWHMLSIEEDYVAVCLHLVLSSKQQTRKLQSLRSLILVVCISSRVTL